MPRHHKFDKSLFQVQKWKRPQRRLSHSQHRIELWHRREMWSKLLHHLILDHQFPQDHQCFLELRESSLFLEQSWLCSLFWFCLCYALKQEITKNKLIGQGNEKVQMLSSRSNNFNISNFYLFFNLSRSLFLLGSDIFLKLAFLFPSFTYFFNNIPSPPPDDTSFWSPHLTLIPSLILSGKTITSYF